MDYSFKPFTTGNVTDFCELYQAVNAKKIAEDLVIKKFSGVRESNQFLGFLAYDQSKPIAFYGAVPIQMRYQNMVEMAAQSVDTMTLPDYRGKGLFTHLAQATYSQMQETGITFIFGFPNQNSEWVFLNKLDWKYSERLCGYTIKTGSFPIDKIAKILLFKNLYNFYLNALFSKYKTGKFPKQSIPENQVSVYRNAEYLSYKKRFGNFIIAISGCLFWIKINNGLYIGEIEANSKADFENAFAKLVQICERCGIREINFQVSPDLPINEWMKNLKARKFDSWIVGYRNFSSSFPLEKLKFTLADADIF